MAIIDIPLLSPAVAWSLHLTALGVGLCISARLLSKAVGFRGLFVLPVLLVSGVFVSRLWTTITYGAAATGTGALLAAGTLREWGNHGTSAFASSACLRIDGRFAASLLAWALLDPARSSASVRHLLGRVWRVACCA